MELAHLSKTSGLGGTLKAQSEDFVVDELGKGGTALSEIKPPESRSGKFTHFILKKKDWSTADAIKVIAKKLGIGQSRFNFAGNKDKRAVTTQLVSVFGVEPEAVLAVRNKDMEILGAWKASKKVELGELVGNRFQLRVDGGKDDEKAVKQIEKELNGVFPNYFGEQRFGSTRKNTARIGELLIRGALEEAAMAYLTDTEGEENKEATAARKELAESRDFAAALKTFPNYLRLERSMIAHLAAQPSDYRGALRTLPRNILMLFVHALQSEIFNEMVSARVKANDFKLQEGEYYCGKNSFDFPDITKRGTKASPFLAAKIVGYETIELNEHEFDLLEKKELKPSDFRVKELPEIGSKGTHRVMLAPYKDFAYQKSVFSFSIPAGAYATVLMREFLDEKQK